MKTKNKFLVFIMAVIMVFSAIGCATIIDGSKITKAVMTLEFYGADGEVASTSTVTLHLYENNAPDTVAHVKKLIKDKYYDGVCVNNVANHFIELGEYEYDQNGKMVKKAYNYGAIAGEFENNGFSGQKLGASAGAIVMKHDRTTNSTATHKYDTATSGLYFLTAGLTDLNENEYCVIGKIVQDDGETSVSTSSSVEVEDIDRTELSSFGIINSIRDVAKLKEETQTTTNYYNEKTDTWYKKVVTEDEERVFKLGDEEVEITGDELEEFNEIFASAGSGFADEYYSCFLVPYYKVIVKSIRIK